MVGRMKERKYYSIRTGKHTDSVKIDLLLLKKLFLNIYQNFHRKYYFQEAYGYECVDVGFVPGIAGEDIETFFFRKLRKINLFPIEEKIEQYSEDDLFDIIELLYDLISKPIEGRFHSYYNCGWHYSKFDKESGKLEYKQEINEILNDYQEGYEISSEGELLLKGEPGLDALLRSEISEYDPENVDNRVKSAVLKYRRHRSSPEDKKEAVRVLADVLEFLRPQIKQLSLSKDENELFNIANNFSIRHHNPTQKTDYSTEFLDWIFYAFLSTIYLVIQLKKMK